MDQGTSRGGVGRTTTTTTFGAPDDMVAAGKAVLDYSAPASKRAIEAFRAGDTSALLLKFAAWFAPPGASGEDLLSDALIAVCDPDHGRPWDPARGSFTAHMRLVIRDLARRERRSARARREILESTFAIDESVSEPLPAADEALSDARGLERLRRLGRTVRERVSHNPRTLQVFDLACEGVEGADELARRLHCSVADIYASNRQLARYGAQVLAEDNAAEEARMRGLREMDKKGKVTT